MTVDGWLTNPLIIQGSVTGEIFLEWLEQHVLPKLGPGWVLFMDNASTHRMLEVRELCSQYLVTLEELPPYSPDFNPIEQAFHVLKMWTRRHQDQAALFDNFGDYLEVAVEAAGGIHAKAHFGKSGYDVGQWD